MADSLASQIITAIGGPENVRSLTHCATRLRFELVDASKVDQNSLEHMQGVLGAVPQSGDRFQVVIGGGVATVYENIMHLPEMAGVGGASASDDGQKSNADVKAEARSKARGKVAWLDSFFEYLSDSFRPILGVLLGASIIIALVNLLISLNVIPNDEVSAGWVFVKAIWKGVFYFLPIMVAYNASKKLKVDPWLGGAIMAMLMTPQFTGLMDAKTTTCVENAALGTKSCMANIFGLPMALSDYSGNVFVPLLMAAVLALVYHGLKRIIPESVQLVFVPFFCMIIVGALTAFVIGPIGVWVGNGLGVGLAWMNTHAPFIFAIIIPMLYPFLVPLGLHWPLNALMLMNIQTLGYDFIQGPMGVWNFACFGATAGVLFLAVRDKDKDMRQTALGALAAGLLGGVSEPSLYGIHLRYKLIYKRMLVGCGLGGVVIAILGWLFPSVTAAGQTVHGVTTTAFAFTSLLTIPVFNQMWVYAVSIAVSFLTSFLLIITFDYRTPEQKIPEKPWDYPWETCMTMANQWSYLPGDKYKSTRELVHYLVDIVSKGGNFLLNVGVDGNGEIPPEGIKIMKEMGAWMKVNGEAIYETRPIAPYKEAKICYTKHKNNGKVYAIYLNDEDEPNPPSQIMLYSINPAKGAKISLLGYKGNLSYKRVGNGVLVTLPSSFVKNPPCGYAWSLCID